MTTTRHPPLLVLQLETHSSKMAHSKPIIPFPPSPLHPTHSLKSYVRGYAILILRYCRATWDLRVYWDMNLLDELWHFMNKFPRMSRICGWENEFVAILIWDVVTTILLVSSHHHHRRRQHRLLLLLHQHLHCAVSVPILWGTIPLVHRCHEIIVPIVPSWEY